MIAAFVALSVLALPKDLPTSTGKPLAIASSSRPILVVALTSDCPHTKKAIPILNQLYKKLQGKVILIGLLHKDAKFVKALSHKLGTQFLLVADEKSSLINLIGAQHSLDVAWIEQGKATKSSDGMSRDKVKALFAASPNKAVEGLASDANLIGTANESGCTLD